MLDSILRIFIFNPICPRTFLNLLTSFTVLFYHYGDWFQISRRFRYSNRNGNFSRSFSNRDMEFRSLLEFINHSFQLVIIELWRQKFKRIPNQCWWSMFILIHIFMIYLLGLLNIRSCIIGLLDLSFLTCLLIFFFYDKLSYNEVFEPYGHYCWFYTIYFFRNFLE